MRGPAFASGAIIGGAFVAALFCDPFRDFCRKGLISMGGQVQKQLASVASDFKQTLDTTAKTPEHTNDSK